MSPKAIDINIEIAEACISRLNELSMAIKESTRSDFEVVGAGYTRDYMETVNNNFLTLTNSLHYMVNNTIEFLVQTKDGYLNADQDTAKDLKALQ